MSPAFSPICQTLSSLSLITNLYLVYVYFRCPLKAVNSYKYFFLLTAIQDIIYSSCLILVLPVAIVENFSLVFIATGPLYRKEVGQIFMIIFIVVFITSILLVANSFLYRYLQVCRHHFFEHVMAPRNLSIIVFVNGAILANWMAVVYISFWPNREFTEHISHKAQEFTGLDPFESAQLGISIRHISLLQFLLLAETVVFLSLTVNAILFSAVKIHNTLKRATYSQSMRRLQKQMFTLLLLQSACPFAFLQGPSFIICVSFLRHAFANCCCIPDYDLALTLSTAYANYYYCFSGRLPQSHADNTANFSIECDLCHSICVRNENC